MAKNENKKGVIVLGAAAAGLGLAGFMLGVSVTAGAHETPADNPHANEEQCHGVVKAGANDCGAGAHGCSGAATTDGDPAEWLYLPAGICARLVNGTTGGSVE